MNRWLGCVRPGRNATHPDILNGAFINHPEAANLAAGKIRRMPWVVNGEIGVIDGLYLSLSFDHRILDGAEAARFANEVIQYIEHPETIK